LPRNGLVVVVVVVVVIHGSTGIVGRGLAQGLKGATWLLQGVIERGCGGGAGDCVRLR
jgi:hypothetical protein